MGSTKAIYVEIRVRAPLDRLWEHTQEPALHAEWDLRFSSIDYLPRASDAVPQRFRYSTRIGLGLPISGEGETLGQRDLPGGGRSSALSFSSADPRSLILHGSGYWKYVPTADGIRFLTGYDYQPRFGRLGRLVDRWAFRPLIGWATAWSFDRLRLWLEEGVRPAAALKAAVTRTVARLTVAFVFAYQGLVPKLLLRHRDELAMLRDAGVTTARALDALAVVGALELLFALCLVVCWRARWPAWAVIGLMVLATVGVGLRSPGYFGAAFNPAVLNAAVAALAVLDLVNRKFAPTAARCLRTPPEASA